MTPTPDTDAEAPASAASVAVERAAYDDLRGMLGAYFPSLPRVLECQPVKEEQKASLRFASTGGEPLAAYCQRVGPLSVSLACALVYRLTAELAALHAHFPQAEVSIDLGSAVIGVWQDEFLQLRVSAFDLGETPRPAASQTLGLLQICRQLITGAAEDIPEAIAVNIPSTLLMHLRLLEENLERATLSWPQLKNVLLDVIATYGRTLRSAGLGTLLALQQRVLPAGCTLPPPLPAGTIRLSRLLAQRDNLGQSEVAAFIPRVRQVWQSREGGLVHFEPRQVWIKLPASYDPADPKSLDMRLDSSAAFEISLQAPGADSSWTASPVMALEAAEENQSFEDLRADPERQLLRLGELMLSGLHGLRRYDRASAPVPDGVNTFRLTRPGTTAATTLPKPENELPDTSTDVDAVPPAQTENPPNPESPPPNTSTLMKPIVLTLGSGGTGKSMLARLLYDFAAFDEREHVRLYDCDVEGNRDFQKIDPDRIQSVETASTELIRLFVGAASHRQPVFADLPSSCLQRFASELTPEILCQLKEEADISWLPVHLLTARASSVPVLLAWRQQLWGEMPSVIVVSQKDGQVPQMMVEQVVRPQDTVIRLPMLDAELAAATDLAAATWRKILHNANTGNGGPFANPLLKLQLKKKRDDFEKALRPLVAMLAGE